MSVVGAISNSFTHFAQRPAIWVDGMFHSYADLQATSAGIQNQLRGLHDVNLGRIGLVTGDDFLTYASLLAIWATGGAYVPLNRHSPPERNLKIIREAKISVVLASHSQECLADCLPEERADFQVVDTRRPQAAGEVLDFSASTEDDLAYIMFTSGSTGTPKGVSITHRNLDSFMNSVTGEMNYSFSPNDRFLQMFEMTFDLSVMSVFAPWSCGACCYVVPDHGISYVSIADILGKQEITVALMVPSVLIYLQRYFDELSFPSLRLNLFCGEALPHDLVARWASCVANARIENVYGPTEATIFCTRYTWEPDSSASESVNGVVPIGKPMPSCQVTVLNESNEACGQNERGELVLAGPQVMRGYWQDPVKTAAAFVHLELDGQESTMAYRTGDIVFVNDQHNLVYCGRADSQVKIDGHRVELQEIEHFARQFTGVSAAVIILEEGAHGPGGLHLYVVSENTDADGLREHLKKHLPDYMLPRHIEFRGALPLNRSGKIDRKSLANSLRGSDYA